MLKNKNTSASRNWSTKVTLESDALDLEESVFTWHDLKKIARSLKNQLTLINAEKHRHFVLPCPCWFFILIVQAKIST